MTSVTTRPETTATPERGAAAYRVFSILTGVAALAVLLQGLWAGIFLQHDGQRDNASSWIDVHARGGEVALLFAALATGWVFVRLRNHRDLLIGGIVLTVLLAIEAYIGGLIRDESKDVLTAVHVPLGMAIMAVAVWLPVRAAHHRP
jgi:hypothetical protein